MQSSRCDTNGPFRAPPPLPHGTGPGLRCSATVGGIFEGSAGSQRGSGRFARLALEVKRGSSWDALSGGRCRLRCACVVVVAGAVKAENFTIKSYGMVELA
jgi:hypothetical protein